jgi:hypothetical protein
MDAPTKLPTGEKSPSRWSVLVAIGASYLAGYVCFVTKFAVPLLAGTEAFRLITVLLMTIIAGFAAPHAHRPLTFALLTLPWMFYSLLIVLAWFTRGGFFYIGPTTLFSSWLALAAAFLVGVYLGRFRIRKHWIFLGLSLILLVELPYIFFRDSHLLIRFAKPRNLAFNARQSSRFFFSVGERINGLTYIAVQRATNNPAQARLVFQKAVRAVDDGGGSDGAIIVVRGQLQGGFLEDAAKTLTRVNDPFQFRLYLAQIAVAAANGGHPELAQRWYAQLLKLANDNKDPFKRDQEVYLLGFRQMEGGRYAEARETAALVNTPWLKEGLLDEIEKRATKPF